MANLKRTVRRRQARGFTLIEALVVISILGILIALLIPAVMTARESARRLECQNHLKQIGIALQSLQSQTGAFPSPMPPREYQDGRMWAGDQGVSGYFELLPFSS